MSEACIGRPTAILAIRHPSFISVAFGNITLKDVCMGDDGDYDNGDNGDEDKGLFLVSQEAGWNEQPVAAA